MSLNFINSNSTTFDQFLGKLQNNLQLSGDVVKNYKIWYVWEGEKYEISEKDEYNYLIQGKEFLASEVTCPPNPTFEDLIIYES